MTNSCLTFSIQKLEASFLSKFSMEFNFCISNEEHQYVLQYNGKVYFSEEKHAKLYMALFRVGKHGYSNEGDVFLVELAHRDRVFLYLLGRILLFLQLFLPLELLLFLALLLERVFHFLQKLLVWLHVLQLLYLTLGNCEVN